MGIIIFFAVLFIVLLAFSKAPENKSTPAQQAAQVTVTIFFGIPLIFIAILVAVYYLSQINWSLIGSFIKGLFYTLVGSLILIYTCALLINLYKGKVLINLYRRLTQGLRVLAAPRSSEEKTPDLEASCQKPIKIRNKKTLYQYIQVSTTASENEIRDACHEIISLCEAAIKKGDTSASSMLLIAQDAQRILLDPQKRSQYDKVLYEKSNSEISQESAIKISHDILTSKKAFYPTKENSNFTRRRKYFIFFTCTFILILTLYNPVINFFKQNESIQIKNNTSNKGSITNEYTGKQLDHYENGQIRSEKNYINGKMDGLVTEWYENGSISQELSYKDGVLDGLVTKWTESGEKQQTTTYKNGSKDGFFISWYKSGNKAEEASFRENKLNGLRIIYDEYEGVRYGEIYDDGLLIDLVTADEILDQD